MVVRSALAALAGLIVSVPLTGIASAQVGRVGFMEVSSPPGNGIVFIEGDEIHVLVRINSGATNFSHENGPPRLAIDIGANTRLATVTTTTVRDSITCARPRGTANGALSSNLCFVYTVVAADLDEDGISIGPDALDPNGATFGDSRGPDSYGDLRASDNTVLSGHAITNDRVRLVDGSLTERPPVNPLAVHPGIIGVSVAAPAHGDTFYTGERISVAVRHNRSVRVRGNTPPSLTPASAGTCARPVSTGRVS